MATQTVLDQSSMSFPRVYSSIEQYVLYRFHPRCLFIDTAGLIWFTYFFWIHEWRAAVGAFVVGRAIGLISVITTDAERLGKTSLGKIALLHLNPVNFIVQLFGVIVLLYGLWNHATEGILGGVSIILLGHSFGWGDVDQRLSGFDY